MGKLVYKKIKISRYFLLDFRKNFMLKYVSKTVNDTRKAWLVNLITEPQTDKWPG